MAKSQKRSDCLVSSTLELLGDKWTLLIVRDLIFENKRTYGEFLKSGERIATNILADRLKTLKAAGIITSKPNPEKRSSAVYELTEKGIGLLPLLVEINLWAEHYYPATEETRERLDLVKRDKAAFIQTLSDSLRERAQKD